MDKQYAKILHQRKYLDDQYIKRCSTSLVSRETQIETTMRYYYIFTRMATVKKIIQAKSQWEYETAGPLIHYQWEWKNGAITLQKAW